MSYIDDVFNVGGYLAQAIVGYSPRKGQIDYAWAVDAAITGNRHLVAEGPTGTGKSFGYLVPATYHAVKNHRRVMVVTSNIPLQEQLITKDLPALAEVLPWKFTYAMLKGKNNYLCVERYEKEKLSSQRRLDSVEEQAREEIITWGAFTKDGDKSGLPRVPPDNVWRDFSVSPDDCSGKHCAFFRDCFSAKAKEQAHSVNVLVTNYHIFFAHLQVKEDTGRELVLPQMDVVILDEGHDAAEIARDFFGFQLRSGTFKWLAHDLPARERDLLTATGAAYCSRLASYSRTLAYSRRLKARNPVQWRDLLALLQDAESRYANLALGESDLGRRAQLKQRGDKAHKLADHLEEAMTLSDPEKVYYIERFEHGSAALCSKPVSVSGRLGELLFRVAPTVVVTSATLAVNGCFDHVVNELGVGDCASIVVDSPFKWEDHALLVLPQGLPEPTIPAFQNAMATTVAHIVDLARGRTLALFTSYRNLNAVYDRLKDMECGYPILRQGDLPRTTLVEEFKEVKSSVLLGTDSFWQGIDVPGEALACLVVDKLPFPTPDDPVLDLLTERDPAGWFMKYSLPRAILKLKQGVGRLLRTANDYGVVVVLDARLVSKGYGQLVLGSLPRMTRTRNLKDIREFLDVAYPVPAATS